MSCVCGAGHDHSVAPPTGEGLDESNDRVACLMATPEFWDERARFHEACVEHYQGAPDLEVHLRQSEKKAKECRARAEVCRRKLRGAA